MNHRSVFAACCSYVVWLAVVQRVSGAPFRITINDIIKKNVPEYDTTLDVDDFANSVMVPDVDLKKLGLRGNEDPLLKARKFEGDILGISDTQDLNAIPPGAARSAIRDKWRRWPTKQIPYVLSSRYGSYSKQVIAKAMDQYHKKTCIRFVPRDRDKHEDYVYIYPDDGCYSLVGRSGGRQPISLDPGCMELGTIIHELMHAVGFFHEQSRTDRDDYIKVMWHEIMPGAKDQFEKYDTKTVNQLGIHYDYNSIMHYGPYAFSRNGARTIVPLKKGATKMGQRDGFSDLDLAKVNKLYDCDDLIDGDTSTHQSTDGDGGGSDVHVRPRTPDNQECVNEKWECYFWAFLNHCRLYPEFMRRNCRKACNMCDEEEEVMTVKTVTESGSGRTKKCEDHNGHCELWAERGFCDRTGYRHFMQATCPLSCQDCESGRLYASQKVLPQTRDYNEAAAQTSASPGCADRKGLEKRCQLFASWNMCDGRNEQDMRRLCARSCGFCTDSKGKTATTKAWP